MGVWALAVGVLLQSHPPLPPRVFEPIHIGSRLDPGRVERFSGTWGGASVHVERRTVSVEKDGTRNLEVTCDFGSPLAFRADPRGVPLGAMSGPPEPVAQSFVLAMWAETITRGKPVKFPFGTTQLSVQREGVAIFDSEFVVPLSRPTKFRVKTYFDRGGRNVMRVVGEFSDGALTVPFDLSRQV